MQDHRCPRCGALLARSEPGQLELRRSDFKARVEGDFRVKISCYRCAAEAYITAASCDAPRG
jgi:phage FluMu protein Com